SLGGQLLFEGTPRALARVKSSATGDLLRSRLPSRDNHQSPIAIHKSPAGLAGRLVPFRRAEGAVTVVGARQHNLNALTARLTLGRLIRLSGASGSGKSALGRYVPTSDGGRPSRGLVSLDDGKHDSIEGLESLAVVQMVDQSPLGRSARSNPVSYVKAWD